MNRKNGFIYPFLISMFAMLKMRFYLFYATLYKKLTTAFDLTLRGSLHPSRIGRIFVRIRASTSGGDVSLGHL